MSNENKELMIINENMNLTEVEKKQLCIDFIKSKFSSKFENVSDAFIALKFGEDLGLSPTSSWKHIHVINGNPGLSAQSMLALVKGKCPNLRIQIISHTRELAKIKIWEDKNDKEFYNIFEYSMEDAKIAEDSNKDTYKKHPKQMLWARVISNMCRMIFPHIINGLYTPEELEFFEPLTPLTPNKQKVRQKSIKETEEYINKKNKGQCIDVTPEMIEEANNSKKSETKRGFEDMQKALKLAKSKGMKLKTSEWRKNYWNEGVTWESEEEETDWDNVPELTDKEFDETIKTELIKAKKSKKKIVSSEENALKQLEIKPKKEIPIDLGRLVKKKTSKKKGSKNSSKPSKKTNNKSSKKKDWTDEELIEPYSKLTDTQKAQIDFEEYKELKRNSDK